MKAPERLDPAQAAFLSDAALAPVMVAIEAAGGEVRANGGTVRNALLGEPIRDVDLSTNLTPQHVTEVLQRAGIKVVPTGIEHGTVTAVSHGRGFEITTLREDVETDGRRAVVRFGADWTADASRRDFTMNALYCDRHGRVFDPLGGYGDLVARKIRFIGDPAERISEDRLRILRFFRFFAWYGHGRPDADGLRACVRARDGLRGLSAERVWHEFRRLLEAPDPVRSILWMRQSGILDIVLPECGGWGTDLMPRLATSEAALGWPADPLLRLMAIIPPRPETALSVSARLKMSNAETERLLHWTDAGLPPLATTTEELRRRLYAGEPRAILDWLMLERSRLEGAAGPKDAAARSAVERMIAEARSWKKPVFPVKGKDLVAAGWQPGPEMGRELARLEKAWIDSGFSLTRDALLGLSAPN